MNRSQFQFLLLATLMIAPGLAANFTLPLAFEPNQGQADKNVQFLARAPGQTVWFTSAEFILRVHGESETSTLRYRFADGSPDPALEPEHPLRGKYHYLNGNRPDRWIKGVPTWGRLRRSEVYEGVDVVFYGRAGRLEFDFIVAAGADPRRIRIAVDGSGAPRIDAAGDLVFPTAAGEVRQHRPVAFQRAQGERRDVETGYKILETGEIALIVGDYDRGKELVIDPVISFSTFWGGTGLDEGRAIAVDSEGNVYITGTTHSVDLPTTEGARQTEYKGSGLPGDAFVTKLSPDGSTVIFSTFLGGIDSDIANAIALGPDGGVFIAGETISSDFPRSAGAYQFLNMSASFLRRIYPEGFVSKLSPDGSSLIYSTYLGDIYSDVIRAIAVDAQGNAYVGGSSDSDAFPVTAGAFDTFCPGTGFGGFVAKFNLDGSELEFSTRLCGSAHDDVTAIDLDAAGNVFVAGTTSSADFPVSPGALRIGGGLPDRDAFLAKLSPTADTLIYSTYLGGGGPDEATSLVVSNEGVPYVAGFTQSPDYPTTRDSVQFFHGDDGSQLDAFVTTVNQDGTGVVQSTFVGGKGVDRANGIALDASGRVLLTGSTSRADFPTTPIVCQTGFRGGYDAFVARLTGDLSAIEYSVLLGGKENDRGLSIAPGPDDSIFVTGQTWSPDFSTTDTALRRAYDHAYGGGSDAFVARIDEGPAPSAPCVAVNGLLNGASFQPGPVAPGEIFSVFGFGLGPAAPAVFTLNGGNAIATELAGTRVLFNGVPAPVILAADWQVNGIVPYSAQPGEQTRVVVEYSGATTAELNLRVARSSPAMFTQNSSGSCAGAILNQDNTLNTPANPAKRKSIIQIFVTGEGQTSPEGTDGLIATEVWPKPTLPVKVTIGGVKVPVHYAGAAPFQVAGLMQINAEIVDAVPSGSAIPIIFTVGNNSSPTNVTLAVE